MELNIRHTQSLRQRCQRTSFRSHIVYVTVANFLYPINYPSSPLPWACSNRFLVVIETWTESHYPPHQVNTVKLNHIHYCGRRATLSFHHFNVLLCASVVLHLIRVHHLRAGTFIHPHLYLIPRPRLPPPSPTVRGWFHFRPAVFLLFNAPTSWC